MKRRAFITLGLTMALVALATPLSAANAPTVDSILATNITALGGKAALEKINSRVLKMKLESEMFGAAEGEVNSKAPNKQWSQFELPGLGTMTEGFDGSVAWAKSATETRVKSGEELAKVKRDANFHREVNMKAIYPDLAYKGTEKVDGEEAYVLESKPSAGSREKLYFNLKTGLLTKQESEFEGPQGSISTVTLPQDYRVVDGVKYPHLLKFKINAAGQAFEFSMKIIELKHNVKIDDAKFAKPAA